jgi:NADH-quinone oxidoreductase subunit G
VILGGAGSGQECAGFGLAISEQLNLVRTLEDGTVWNGFNVLHMAAAAWAA